MESLDEFLIRARSWLDANAEPTPSSDTEVWGEGSDSMALFHNLSIDAERAHTDELRRWTQRKADAGFANVSWEPEWGGRGLPHAYERAFADLESQYLVPTSHEAITITTHLIAPTIRAVGTDQQRRQFLSRMLRTDDLWCQMFSEPAAGSDLAGATTRATRDGDDWVIDGQKVWTSGAQFAEWGYIICRTDPSLPKHRGLTAFVVPMSSEGVEVRPLRQITGGASFNEVFLTNVRVSDSNRLGEVGEGWSVALTTLGFERVTAGADESRDTATRLIALARHLGRHDDAVVRQGLARAFTHQRLRQLNAARVNARLRAGETPGPEGSIGKLFWTESLQLWNEVASALLGPRLSADTDEWGTYAWAEHVLGAPGFRIAAGTDEVQRNILGERVLGLPGEPRVDRDIPFSEVPR